MGKELFLVMNELVDAINKLGETSIWDVVSSFGTIVAVGALLYQFWYDRRQSRPCYKVHIKSKVFVEKSNQSNKIITLTLTNIGNRATAIDAISAVNTKNNLIITERNSLIKSLSEREFKKRNINLNEVCVREIDSNAIFVETLATPSIIKYPIVLDVGQIHVLNIDCSKSGIDFSKMYIVAQDTLGTYYQSDYTPDLINKI